MAAGGLLRARSLDKRYGSVHALGPLDLDLPRGAWALLGPNGAGKTTLIRLLLGLTRPSKGAVNVLGMDPVHEATDVRSRIGYMPERPALLPGLTGVQYVTLAARLNGLERTEARRGAHAALDEVGLGEARYRDVEGYSTGMRQRVKLAQALAHDPDLLILDEPTNGLDPDGRDEMLDLVKELGTQGRSLLLASHILPEVRRVCQQAVILNQGEAVHVGALADLQVDLGGTVLEPLDPPEALIEALKEAGHEVSRDEDRIIVEGSIPVPELLGICHDAGVAVRAARPHTRAMHDVVVELMEGGAA